ncbi:MAG: UDP-N-acetylglucosamine 2-epimerase, partial [Candidatus Margulisiibacteriota bacterium]
TEGAIDESIRHSLTKMSAYHFPAAEAYRKRIIQMGEEAGRVFNFGHIGMDNIKKLRLLTKEQIAKDLNFDLKGRCAIVTYHPVTLEGNSYVSQIRDLLGAVKGLNIKIIFTKSNADSGGRRINEEIGKFCKSDPSKYKFVDNLGQVRYLSCLKNFDLMIGNSSSGLFEGPSFKIPTVNIGDRQKGRLRSSNIIDCAASKPAILRAVTEAFSSSFRKKALRAKNPYEKPGIKYASRSVKDKLKILDLDPNMLKKPFFDIDFKYKKAN